MNGVLERAIVEARVFNKKGNLGTETRISNYLSFLFKDIDIAKKKAIDIGAGFGVFSLHMARADCARVVSLEPELDGGSIKMVKFFRSIMDELNIKTIEIRRETFQEYMPNGEQFDIVLLHNSVNHLNEDLCVKISDSEIAVREYRSYFKKLNKLMVGGGVLIITDCSSENAFSNLGLRSPFAPSIEWKKHQTPEVWESIAKDEGFELVDIRWTPFAAGGIVLSKLTTKQGIARLLFSHFCLRLRKVKN